MDVVAFGDFNDQEATMLHGSRIQGQWSFWSGARTSFHRGPGRTGGLSVALQRLCCWTVQLYWSEQMKSSSSA